jgi:hypothetical protein
LRGGAAATARNLHYAQVLHVELVVLSVWIPATLDSSTYGFEGNCGILKQVLKIGMDEILVRRSSSLSSSVMAQSTWSQLDLVVVEVEAIWVFMQWAYAP